MLAVTDVEEWQPSVLELTEAYGYRVLTATSSKRALQLADETNIDLVVSEAELDGEDGVHLLEQYRTAHPEVTRILVRGGLDDHTLVRDAADRAAIYQYLRKPLDSEQVGLVAKRTLEARELGRRHRLLSRELKLSEDSPVWAGHMATSAPTSQSFEKLVFASAAMSEICELARRAAKTHLPILIQGETGTGKELLARAVHYRSERRQAPLLVQNCGGLPDELLHSELFGHKRGAFTGAVSDRLGLFRAADGGTVFLDEISELSPSFQVSLLRFLQEGEVKPLGSDDTVVCDVRIIAASNRKLEEMVARREFRSDLYYRLKGFELHVPPLRERR
ncbi:MAG: sigma-54-dependent Fis family transcriptional regulator, partial [Acidobacteria bacterium]|nr:sigma-54-dependent Fis family transcriptional regulator [Acidobacteriota bacterium]